MSVEQLSTCYNNNLEKMSIKKFADRLQMANVGYKKVATTGDENKIKDGHDDPILLNKSPAMKEGIEGKMRLISSSDSGQGTANEQVCSDDKSFQSDGHANGDNIDSPSDRSRSNSSGGMQVQEKLRVADSKFNQDDVTALFHPVGREQTLSQASESENQSRTVSWVNTCTDAKNFYNHLDVKKYYSTTRGEAFMNDIYEKINKRDRYNRRVNYDPDQPAAGTENDMEYKFYLDKMGVKKLIGFQGENSETIRAVNQVDFYVSKDQDDSETEIVTIRGSWENVRRTVSDIKNMMNSVGKDICVSHINTAVNPGEFVLQNLYTQYLRIRLNNMECVSVVGAMGTTVMMQNVSDYRYHRLAQLDTAINTVYGTKDGWKQYFKMPPERVPLPINDFSVVVAPDARGTYYRAIVESSNIESGEVQVWFLDWGGRTVVSVDRIYKLHNSFNELPYVGLVGNLAGCQLNDPEENESFGRFLFQFIRRHMPVKVKAVNMDAYGYYTILLYGNGGECINHLLIDNKWVNSVPYCTYQPFMDEGFVPAQFYDPDAKEILEFKFKAYEPFPGYYPDQGIPDIPEQRENHQVDVPVENHLENGQRPKHGAEFNTQERHVPNGFRKYRYQKERYYGKKWENEDGSQRYRPSHERRRGYNHKQAEHKTETQNVPDKPKASNSGANGSTAEKSVQPPANKNSQKPVVGKPSKPSPTVQEQKKPAVSNSTATVAEVHSDKAKMKPPPVTKAKVEVKEEVVPETSDSSKCEASKTSTEEKSKNSDAAVTESVATTESEPPTSPTCSVPTNATNSHPADNPWNSDRVSKSNIYSPKAKNEKTASSKPSSSDSSSKPPVSCTSSVASPCPTSKSHEKLSKSEASSTNQMVSSRTFPSLKSEEPEPDHWTVVSSKRRSRRKGKY